MSTTMWVTAILISTYTLGVIGNIIVHIEIHKKLRKRGVPLYPAISAIIVLIQALLWPLIVLFHGSIKVAKK